MKRDDIINSLKEKSSIKYQQNVVRMGIPEHNSIGVSTGEVRKLAKKINKLVTAHEAHKLGLSLWQSGYHEGKLLAVLLVDPFETNEADIERFMQGIHSWDLCDHVCKNLIVLQPKFREYIHKWCDGTKTYYKRAAFCLMAASCVPSSKIQLTREDIDDYLHIIRKHADDERTHVKKAVSWALREIGKKHADLLERALTLAYELHNSASKHERWIGRHALKELENLVTVNERERLISSQTKMGKSAGKPL
ncbi:DNA alkylation repair protein [Halalkalibacter sp. APA_J-10(15)]|uniref:DNA alkylation repair protein n=1 Tax=Halalkalibacter sp. APA_J-10(15) TaxID=2933805 RepID=UPI001FF14B2F|nr:DNA alkylation repair protein [Halalkalibacter sp. APA_J-10(15)]MCK0473752.1 DNA alkylation repair protein [Halalkalibacter sp. APA_J-10(15)]